MRTATVLTALALVPLISGCAFTERSEQAYCGKYREGLEQIVADHPELDPDTAGGGDPLVALISATSAWGDVVALTGELAEVAPDEIRPSVERVHDTLQKQLDAVGDLATNPFGVILGQVFNTIANSAAFERMDRYTAAHCGSAPTG